MIWKNSLFKMAIVAMIFLGCKNKTLHTNAIDNITTFSKLYGYIKYFHPSSESQELDWNYFAIYGVEQVEKCNSRKDLVKTLNQLFKPIAPSIRIFEADNVTDSVYDFSKIIPSPIEEYEKTYWQHKGLGLGMIKIDFNQNTYKSTKVNTKNLLHDTNPSGKMLLKVDVSKFRGKLLKYSAFARIDNEQNNIGQLRLEVHKSDKTIELVRKPITKNAWLNYEITSRIDSSANFINVGCITKGRGALFFDQVKLSYKDNNEWVEIPLKNGDFEKELDINIDEWVYFGTNYSFDLTEEQYLNGKKSLAIKYLPYLTNKSKRLFDYSPKFKELIQKEVGENIFCQIPLVLYTDTEKTFPHTNSDNLKDLIKRIDEASYLNKDKYQLLGNIVNIYNVFQHFYPYLDEIDLDWEKEMKKAFLASYNKKETHLTTLKKFTATLKDGHLDITQRNGSGTYIPPINWELVENQLVVTRVLDSTLLVNVGDIVTHVNGQDSHSFLEGIKSQISAGSKTWLNYQTSKRSLFGKKGSKLTIRINKKEMVLIRNNYPSEPKIGFSDFEKINDSVCYLNLTTISANKIEKVVPILENSKSIICDLRGRPNKNHNLIGYFLKEKDTSTSWMKVPRIVYPDQERIIGYDKYSWSLKNKKPYLGNKQIVFITNGKAISYSESFMGYIEGYSLGTIVGEPTAGTNGNINRFILPGGYKITWTGMKVRKLNGDQHHAIGIVPDIYLARSIEDIKSGKDSFFSKALELTTLGE